MSAQEISEIGQPMPAAVAALNAPLPSLIVWLRHVG
jgi:hypothetical protein